LRVDPQDPEQDEVGQLAGDRRIGVEIAEPEDKLESGCPGHAKERPECWDARTGLELGQGRLGGSDPVGQPPLREPSNFSSDQEQITRAYRVLSIAVIMRILRCRSMLISI
jgi:hypothetical protein